MALTHQQVWNAIDAFAARYGMTASGLARKAGLDATTFNRSKRITPEGRPRWPSTESIAKLLEATGGSIDEFLALVSRKKTMPTRSLPLIGFAEAGAGGFFDDGGFPVGNGWEEVSFPHVEDEQAYALEISGDSMQPVYREGDIVIVSPAATARRGDRVVVKTEQGEVLVKELKRQTARTIELRSLNRDHPDRTLATRDIAWMARVVWASQ